MNKTLKLLKTQPGLIMSLPQNDPELAKAAMRGGADILKVHIRVVHAASGTHFGTLAEEKENLQRIIDLFPGPVGIVTGANDAATPREMAELAEMGIDFFDMYAEHMPAWMWTIDNMDITVALDYKYTIHQAIALERMGVRMLEAAIMHHDGYGKPLTTADLACYQELRETVDVPIIVPTQRNITPREAPLLFGLCNIDALMVGAIVTGKTAESIEKAVKEFKKALE
jgi:hypothetical protein